MTDYTLALSSGVFAWDGGEVDGVSRAIAGAFALAGGVVSFTRTLAVDLGDLTLNLDRLQRQTGYFDTQGRPTTQMQLVHQRNCEAIEKAFSKLAQTVNAIQAAYNAAAQASAAASEATSAAEEVRAEVSGVVETVAAIEEGTFNFPSITVGGVEFVNGGGGGGLQPKAEAEV